MPCMSYFSAGAFKDQDGVQWTVTQPKKTEWFRVFGPSDDKTFPILTLDRVALLRRPSAQSGLMASARIASGSCGH